MPLSGIKEVAGVAPPSYHLHHQQGSSDMLSSIPAANWDAAELLYRCVCVANFRVYSHVRHGALPFLTIEEGDIIE